jgi:hypothetical protein
MQKLTWGPEALVMGGRDARCRDGRFSKPTPGENARSDRLEPAFSARAALRWL